jgi:hypothetical protein
MMVKPGCGAARAAEPRDLNRRRLLAHDPGARPGPHGDRLWPGAEPADVTDQHEAGKARVGVIGSDLLDILADPAELGLADAVAVDEDLHQLDLHETDDPALDPQEPAAIDHRLVDEQLHRRLVEGGGFARRFGIRIDRRDFHLLRRDIDAARPPADFAVFGAHRQQRLDRAAGRARQVEAQDESGIPGMIAPAVEPGDIRARQAVGRSPDNRALDRRGDFRDRSRRQGPAVDRQPRAAVGRPGDTERFDREEDGRLGRLAGCLGCAGRGAAALDLKTARGADQQVMQQRVGRLFAALAALFEVEGGVEIGVRVVPLARSFLEIMDERIDIALGNVGISLCVMFGVEEA